MACDALSQRLSRVSSQTLAVWTEEKRRRAAGPFLLPALRQALHGIAEKMLPAPKNDFGCEIPGGDPARSDQPMAQSGLFPQPADMIKELARCRCPQKIPPWLSIFRVGRIHPSNKGNSRQPGIVKFRCGLVKIRGSSEPADGDHTIHLTVVVPAIRTADDKVDAQFVFELSSATAHRPVPAQDSSDRQRNRRFQSGPHARWIARDQIGVRPKRNESRVPQSPGVRRILNHVQMRARMGKIVRHDSDKKDAIGGSEVAPTQLVRVTNTPSDGIE